MNEKLEDTERKFLANLQECYGLFPVSRPGQEVTHAEEDSDHVVLQPHRLVAEGGERLRLDLLKLLHARAVGLEDPGNPKVGEVAGHEVKVVVPKLKVSGEDENEFFPLAIQGRVVQQLPGQVQPLDGQRDGLGVLLDRGLENGEFLLYQRPLLQDDIPAGGFLFLLFLRRSLSISLSLFFSGGTFELSILNGDVLKLDKLEPKRLILGFGPEPLVKGSGPLLNEMQLDGLGLICLRIVQRRLFGGGGFAPAFNVGHGVHVVDLERIGFVGGGGIVCRVVERQRDLVDAPDRILRNSGGIISQKLADGLVVAEKLLNV